MLTISIDFHWSQITFVLNLKIMLVNSQTTGAIVILVSLIGFTRNKKERPTNKKMKIEQSFEEYSAYSLFLFAVR